MRACQHKRHHHHQQQQALFYTNKLKAVSHSVLQLLPINPATKQEPQRPQHWSVSNMFLKHVLPLRAADIFSSCKIFEWLHGSHDACFRLHTLKWNCDSHFHMENDQWKSPWVTDISRYLCVYLFVPQNNSVHVWYESLLLCLMLTRLDESSASAFSLPSSSPSSHSVSASVPAGTRPHSSKSRQRSPTPESRATGGHTGTSPTSEDRVWRLV